ncbi:BrnA antitoxin family protein [Skermanella stibiiresistens]|nr:BrnA antitoxin family protein [Skermanella stibiiresistens]
MANEQNITRRSLTDRRPDQSDWKRVHALTDEEIAQAVADDPDAAPIMDAAWFAEAAKRLPAKKQLTLRLDEDVIEFFKGQGDGYQTRMNAVLRAFMEHAKQAG